MGTTHVLKLFKKPAPRLSSETSGTQLCSRGAGGVRAAYFVFPLEPGILQGTAYFAQAAKEAGLEAVVNMSQITARRVAKSHAAQDHWIAERVFDWSGIPVVHLRPTFFAEWLLYWAGFIKAGILPLPFGTGRHAPIAAEDQARVIASILLAPQAHLDQTYPLFGAQEMTFREMTQEVQHLLGRPLRYEQVDVSTMKALAKEHGQEFGDFFWQHLAEIAIDHQDGVFAGTNDIVERIGGRPPMTIEDFVENIAASSLPSPLAMHPCNTNNRRRPMPATTKFLAIGEFTAAAMPDQLDTRRFPRR